MMQRLVVLGGALVGLGLVAPAAVGQGYRPPDCELNTRHFLVNSGVIYIKGASEEQYPDKRERLLRDANSNLLEAIERGEADNPAVWYFLGRYFALVNDGVGADSAFDRAERLQPACAEDIAYHRQLMWAPLINEAIDSLRAGAFEGAKPLLRQANAIYDEDNIGYYYLARILANEGTLDSSVYYFKRVVEVGAVDSTREENVVNSIYNIGQIYEMLGPSDSAIAWYRKFRERQPDDPEALVRLAQVTAEAGDTTGAVALYDSVLARAPDMTAMDLFQTGEALFVAERFDLAAKAFERGLEKNPYLRPALSNLANTYLAIASVDDLPQDRRREMAAKLEGVARRLVDVDPQNGESLRLLAAAFQMQRKNDSTLVALQRIESMPFEVKIDDNQPGNGTYAVQGRLVNRKTNEATLPPITFEFLDAQGNVVATDTVESATLAGEDSTDFTVAAEGEAIVAYRYRVGDKTGD